MVHIYSEICVCLVGGWVGVWANACSVVSNSLWPHGLQPTRLLHPWDFPGKSIGMDCYFLFQRIFPTQGSNLGLPHCRQTLYHLSHHRSLCYVYFTIIKNNNKRNEEPSPLPSSKTSPKAKHIPIKQLVPMPFTTSTWMPSICFLSLCVYLFFYFSHKLNYCKMY